MIHIKVTSTVFFTVRKATQTEIDKFNLESGTLAVVRDGLNMTWAKDLTDARNQLIKMYTKNKDFDTTDAETLEV